MTITQRKKDPQALRMALLDCAAGIIAADGLSALTLDKVVRLSGISKGGLQYHFPGRQDLVDGVFTRLQDQFLEEINQQMAADPQPAGRATRAYIRSCARTMPDDEQAINRHLMAAIFADPLLRQQWAEFIRHALPADGGNEAAQQHWLLCRLAADGLWFAMLCECHDLTPERQAATLDRLLSFTENAPQ